VLKEIVSKEVERKYARQLISSALCKSSSDRLTGERRGEGAERVLRPEI
jgi:hypothetical protein